MIYSISDIQKIKIVKQLNEFNTYQHAYVDELDFDPSDPRHHFCW